jgi:hypothetical protein
VHLADLTLADLHSDGDKLRLSHVLGDTTLNSSSADLSGFDLLFCDSLSYAVVKHRRSVDLGRITSRNLKHCERYAAAKAITVISERERLTYKGLALNSLLK